MGTLSLVLEYLKDLEECMDDGDSRVAKEAKLFDALKHKSVVIEMDNQKIAIFTKAPLWAFGEPFMRKIVNDVNVEIHEEKFKADFVVLDYVNEGGSSILFRRDFLETTKSQIDFGLGEIKMNLTKFEEGIDVIYLLEEVGSSSKEVVKMGKANRNKGYNINKLTPPPSLRLEEIPPTSTISPQPIYHPLTLKQKENMKEKKLDEILIGKERLNKKEFSEEDKVGIFEHGLPKKMCDPGNYVLLVKINGVVEMVAQVDTEARYQAYVVDILILDIPVDPKLPLLLGRPFLRTCGAIIDMGRDEDGNVKYGPVAPSFIDTEDDMERVLAMEAYFNPFKNVIVFKKLVDFLGSLPVQLKNLDWGNEGYGTYKKVDGDGDWHARFEIVTPSGRKFNRAFKTKTTTRKLSGKFKAEDVLRSPIMILIEKSRKDTLPNPLIAEYERRNKRNTITYSLQPVSNANLKWRDLPSVERHAYCEKLSKLQERSFGVPRVANWRLFDGYGFEDTLREMMKLEYIYEGDGDIFVDYSWERALSIDNEIYPEWVLEFFSTLYFDKDVDRNNLMKEKCIWFRLCGHEHILTLPEFAVVLGLFTEDEIVHKVIVGSLVHRVASRERCQKRDLWMISALEESRRVSLAWIIADHLYKHAPGIKENSVICTGHYVTKIACFLGYCVDDKIKKCSEPIDYEYWISKMLVDELDVENTCLKKETKMPTQAKEGSSEPRQEHGGLNSSWGDWNASLSEIERGNVWRDFMLI
ncbi:hypothetical protein Tco_0842502 [Tanacetum coccineum]|uniref:Uncharacterized protein n=1 Tax=Tanacetum coccineum TaxID=301880 RepID=A0ABQ5AZG5_9ASTR